MRDNASQTAQKDLSITIITSGISFVLIPAGEFVMGSPETEEGRDGDEGPQHTVKITKPFYLHTTEVTQAQWKDVMGSNPSHFTGDDLPVERVSWADVQEFIEKLSARDGVEYRLPTEAEWEYACRAGSTARFCFGNDENELGDYAWYYGNSGSKTHPVGSKKPNAWGLYDMHGNVWEWCQDRYDADYYSSSPVNDPQGPSSGEYRVLRGGSCFNFVRNCRSAFRYSFGTTNHLNRLGLRLARSSQ